MKPVMARGVRIEKSKAIVCHVEHLVKFWAVLVADKARPDGQHESMARRGTLGPGQRLEAPEGYRVVHLLPGGFSDRRLLATMQKLGFTDFERGGPLDADGGKTPLSPAEQWQEGDGRFLTIEGSKVCNSHTRPLNVTVVYYEKTPVPGHARCIRREVPEVPAQGFIDFAPDDVLCLLRPWASEQEFGDALWDRDYRVHAVKSRLQPGEQWQPVKDMPGVQFSRDMIHNATAKQLKATVVMLCPGPTKGTTLMRTQGITLKPEWIFSLDTMGEDSDAEILSVLPGHRSKQELTERARNAGFAPVLAQV